MFLFLFLVFHYKYRSGNAEISKEEIITKIFLMIPCFARYFFFVTTKVAHPFGFHANLIEFKFFFLSMWLSFFFPDQFTQFKGNSFHDSNHKTKTLCQLKHVWSFFFGFSHFCLFRHKTFLVCLIIDKWWYLKEIDTEVLQEKKTLWHTKSSIRKLFMLFFRVFWIFN